VSHGCGAPGGNEQGQDQRKDAPLTPKNALTKFRMNYLRSSPLLIFWRGFYGEFPIALVSLDRNRVGSQHSLTFLSTRSA
jgi:hypothetical protein